MPERGPNQNQEETDKLKSRTLSDAELLQGGAEYVSEEGLAPRLEISAEQNERLIKNVEAELMRSVLTPANLKSGAVEVSMLDAEKVIGYEFELEEEQRIYVKPETFSVAEWKNYIVDTYDQTSRCRIRNKNGELRLSLKVPLFSRDTERAKVCIRLEFKPRTPLQEKDLERIQELILSEPGTEVHEKWGTPIELKDGHRVYINKDDRGNHWIETDESMTIENLLPEGLTYLGHKKSNIEVAASRKPVIQLDRLASLEGVKKNAADAGIFKKIFRNNLEATSRTVKGKVDTSVSEKKEKGLLSGEALKKRTEKNMAAVADYIWKNLGMELRSGEDVGRVVSDIAGLVNAGISSDPLAFRTWGEGYGERKVPAETLPDEMKRFSEELMAKQKEVESGKLSPADLGSWIELEIDRFIHPYADGCGRVAKAVSAFFLTRNAYPLPEYGTRDEYYKEGMNQGSEIFTGYYRRALTRSIIGNYLGERKK
ncbi:MAG: hypothetical protein AAB692_03685 [Patescibacteria group bacterium]